MKPRSPLVLVVLLVPTLALGAVLGGGTYAAATKIGKNQVVTKSIKNGAVTGAKIKRGAVTSQSVKDGSLTRADLAPGTLPGGKSVQMASIASHPTVGDGGTIIAPSGSYQTPGESYVGIAPVTMRVGDLRVVTAPEGIGQAVQLAIESGPVLGAGSAILSCTVGAGTDRCSNAGSAVIPAGNIFYVRVTNGPGGSHGAFIAVSYTVSVP